MVTLVLARERRESSAQSSSSIISVERCPPAQPCPGLVQEDFPESVACRILTRGDGSVVQQTITPVSLCTEDHFLSLKQRIGESQ